MKFSIWKSSRYSPYFYWINHIERNFWKPIDTDQSLMVSIVVPVYNPPVIFLKKCVASVLAQSYQNWQLIIVDDASTNKHVRQFLSSLSDSRIKVVFSTENQHISQTTNVGIAECEGEYITFLDHDDLLAPQALNEVVVAFQENPNWQWLYSDEDFINKCGDRVSPHFKSDWNPFLLHAHNYITHLSVYKASLLEAIGGFRVGFEGAQDYDLALRASEILKSYEIGHIAKILYHWRIHAGSTAGNASSKPYTVEAGRKALTEHLINQGRIFDVIDGNLENYFHVKYQVDIWPRVSIVIPTRDNASILKNCMDSLLEKTDYPDYEVIVMDNQSVSNDAIDYLRELNYLHNVNVYKYDKIFNYSEINNIAVDKSSGDVIVLLNNDTEIISKDWLLQMVGLAMQEDVGCVGAKLLYPDNSIQHAGIIMGLGGYAAHSHRCMKMEHYGYFNRPHVNQVLSAVTGACLAIRKKTYLQVGGLNIDFKVAYNDVDFCLKIKKLGFYNVYCAGIELLHFESKTRGEDNDDIEKSQRFEQEKARLLECWHNEIIYDPYYSCHLTRSSENFSIRTDFYD